MKSFLFSFLLTFLSCCFYSISFSSASYAQDAALDLTQKFGPGDKAEIAQHTKVKKIFTTLNWVFTICSSIGAIIFGFRAARMLNDEMYQSAIGPFLGSALCAILTYVINLFS